MSDVLTIVPPDWTEIPGANQLLLDYGDINQAMVFLINKEWTMFEPVIETHMVQGQTLLEAYMLNDSFFVRFGLTG